VTDRHQRPPSRNAADQKAAERQRRILELWLERPERQRTSEDILTFYGWLSEHEPGLVPSGAGSYRQLREILKAHIVESGKHDERRTGDKGWH
jgi:hypothetical protein